GPLVINPFLMNNLPYDAKTAFAPVTVVGQAPNVVAIHPDLTPRSLADLVAYGKRKSAPMTYATQGTGTTGHITGALIAQATGLKLPHVPYKGFPPMLTDVMAGRVDMLITDAFNVVPRVRSGELVPIAVSARQ